MKISAGEVPADLVFKDITYLDVFTNEFKKGDVALYKGIIVGTGSYSGKEEVDGRGTTLVPGFIDAHLHIESTTVVPEIFAKEALKHGTTAVITDPHEIANVMGPDGIRYMLEASNGIPLDIFFMMPSCVPSCEFDETGATILVEDMYDLFDVNKVMGLAEVMNTPGVVLRQKEVLDKVYEVLDKDLLIDGHAPEVRGNNLLTYIAAGVMSDHESVTLEEALEKISAGMRIMIREGTAAKNLATFIELFKEPYASRCMLCCDDLHIDDIINTGHIDNNIRKAISLGAEPEMVYKVASLGACNYLGFADRGAIAPGYLADFVILDDAESVKINAVYKHGIKITDEYLDKYCKSHISKELIDKSHNTFNMPRVTADMLKTESTLPVISIIKGQIITVRDGEASAVDVSADILKGVVVERHKNTGHIGIGYVKGYGLKKGAIATSVAHDAHNIIAIGINDEDIAAAVNAVKDMKGGMVVYSDNKVKAAYPLPVAGLMSEESAEAAKRCLGEVHAAAYENGVYEEIDPFMNLSFMSLPVIPDMRITTLGVFDVLNWKLVE